MTSRATLFMVVAAVTLTSVGCDEEITSPSPSMGVRIIFAGPTVRRTDLPASAQACINAVGVTHIHPSWRSFAAFPLQAVPPDRYEITLDDVPRATRVSFRINDQNSCDENPTGAVTRNVFANGVRLAQNTTTPGNGEEAGYALTVSASGSISQ